MIVPWSKAHANGYLLAVGLPIDRERPHRYQHPENEQSNQMNSIGSIPAHVTKLMDAASERAATESQIAYVVAGKQLQASRQTGRAAVELLTTAVDLQAQLSQNRLDVRV